MEKNMQESFMDQWFGTQKKMVDTWKETMNSFSGMSESKSEDDKEEKEDFFKASMKTVQESYDKWINQANDRFLKDMNTFQKSSQEALTKMFGGASLYQDLGKFWADLTSNVTGKDKDIKAFYEKWNDNYMKMMTDYYVSNMPEPMQMFFKEPMNIFQMYKGSSNKFFNPWNEELEKMSSLLTKSMTGDSESYAEFNKIWNEKFSDTFGKVFTMPEFSMNREQMQKQMGMLNEMVKFSTTMNQFYATMAKQTQETFKDLVKSYQDMVKDGTNPKSFKEFYDFWLTRNEESFRDLFSTDDYSKMVAQVLDAQVNVKKEFDNFMEKQLEFLPYPTKTDMDSVYKTIDTLKREVRDLKKEITALKKEKEVKEKDTKEAAKPAATVTKS